MLAVGFHRRQRDHLGQEGEAMTAPAAGAILEIKNVLAGLTNKQFHGKSPARSV